MRIGRLLNFSQMTKSDKQQSNSVRYRDKNVIATVPVINQSQQQEANRYNSFENENFSGHVTGVKKSTNASQQSLNHSLT